MTIARSDLVDVSLTRWYLCVVRCVRGARLLGEGHGDRREWIERRLEELSQIFALSIGGYTVLDNQLIVLIRLDQDAARTWSNAEVARRWGRIVPERDKSRQPLALSNQWITERAKDARWVATARERVQSLSWFMKSLTEPLARLANRQDQTRGKFFEGRPKTVAVLDQESLLAAAVYIDLGLAAAGGAGASETGFPTSLEARRKHARKMGKPAAKNGPKRGRTAGSRPAHEGGEDSLWLCPIEDRRARGSREGMFEGLSLAGYLNLVAFTGRLLGHGTAPVGREVSGILERFDISAASWQSRLEALSQRRGRLLGRVFAASRDRLREAAEAFGVERLSNLDSCPTR
jgi:hypothetical protein